MRCYTFFIFARFGLRHGRGGKTGFTWYNRTLNKGGLSEKPLWFNTKNLKQEQREFAFLTGNAYYINFLRHVKDA